ncbi:MAG: hypothetical protein FJX76_02190 [Armatimonadetes bacterium]|nr:hypothetical protein [Armatimonadota bacterium]
MQSNTFFDFAGFSFEAALQSHTSAPEGSAVELRHSVEASRSAVAHTLGLPARQVVLTMGTTHGFKQLLLSADLFPEQARVVCSDLLYPACSRP